MNPERFLMLARLFEQAKREYRKDTIQMIPMDQINPYDPGHFQSEIDWREYDRQHPDHIDTYDAHIDGIAFIANGMSIHKRQIRSICVIPIDGDGLIKWQRIDGFKRYMAYFDTHQPTFQIPCYVCDPAYAPPGIQDGQLCFID